MKQLVKDHFNECLLALVLLFILIFMVPATIFILAHEGWQSSADGFKWASSLAANLASGVLGALLALLMKQGQQPTPGSTTESHTMTVTPPTVKEVPSQP